MPCRTIFLTGFSQGGTTLLLSLFDGHSQCAVYPDEPGFYKMWIRRKSYRSNEQKFADCLAGLPNRIHLAREYQIYSDNRQLKNNYNAVVADKDSSDVIEMVRKTYRDKIKSKKLRGIEQNLDAETQQKFFQAYFSSLFANAKSPGSMDFQHVYSACFQALQEATNKVFKTGNKREVHVFKQPFTNLKHLKLLDTFLDNFENPKVVFIDRNPHARLLSIINHNVSKGRSEIRFKNRPVRFLSLALKNAMDFKKFARFKKRHSNNKDFVFPSYERLVIDTESQMRDLCKTLGIQFEPALLKPTKLGVGSKVHTNRTGSGASVSVDAMEKWKTELTTVEKLVSRFFVSILAR